jgi:2-C-methyl-D-erythritol 2,4-cyclodiphosphate synthase
MFKIGHGCDTHRLTPGNKLIIGGVNINYCLGLVGHSDADVLVHAIIDSLFGAAGLGDIGLHFPDNNKKYKNISSLELLDRTCSMLKSENFQIVNIDCTVLAESPKINKYFPDMKKNISNTCKIQISDINIKAKTCEKLGFIGEKLGISSHAVALIFKP